MCFSFLIISEGIEKTVFDGVLIKSKCVKNLNSLKVAIGINHIQRGILSI